MSALSNKTDAELALLIKHRQSVLKVMTEDLAEALAEQDARNQGTASYEAPGEMVPWFPQRHCECCGVPTPASAKFCSACTWAHGEKLTARGGCERATAMWEGNAEYDPDEGKPKRVRVAVSAEALAKAASFEGLYAWRGNY